MNFLQKLKLGYNIALFFGIVWSVLTFALGGVVYFEHQSILKANKKSLETLYLSVASPYEKDEKTGFHPIIEKLQFLGQVEIVSNKASNNHVIITPKSFTLPHPKNALAIKFSLHPNQLRSIGLSELTHLFLFSLFALLTLLFATFYLLKRRVVIERRWIFHAIGMFYFCIFLGYWLFLSPNIIPKAQKWPIEKALEKMEEGYPNRRAIPTAVRVTQVEPLKRGKLGVIGEITQLFEVNQQVDVPSLTFDKLGQKMPLVSLVSSSFLEGQQKLTWSFYHVIDLQADLIYDGIRSRGLNLAIYANHDLLVPYFPPLLKEQDNATKVETTRLSKNWKKVFSSYSHPNHNGGSIPKRQFTSSTYIHQTIGSLFFRKLWMLFSDAFLLYMMISVPIVITSGHSRDYLRLFISLSLILSIKWIHQSFMGIDEGSLEILRHMRNALYALFLITAGGILHAEITHRNNFFTKDNSRVLRYYFWPSLMLMFSITLLTQWLSYV